MSNEPDGSERLASLLTARERDELAQVVEAVSKRGRGGFVLLVGSVARGRRSETSDVDILAVAETLAGVETSTVSVQWNDLQGFAAALDRGRPDAFAALRDGLVVYDDGSALAGMRAHVLSRSLTPRLDAAFDDASIALHLARDAAARPSATGGAAVKHAANAVAIAILLSRGVCAASGPELEDQLRGVGEESLAELVRVARADPRPSGWDELLRQLREAVVSG